jgi:GT2 family glycosyltransferase
MDSSTSVIVCAYTEERWDHLVAAIGSVLSQRRPPTEVVLVIDHNPDLLHRASLAFPEVKIVENLGQRGIADARNHGVAASSGSILAFLDDDAAAAPDWLENLTAPYDANDAVIGVGGTAVPGWEKGKPAWFPGEFNWVVGCTYTGHRSTAGPIRNVFGCNMSFLRSAFETAGGFERGLGRVGKVPVGGEETELSIRAARAVPGGLVWYEPGAEISHFVPSSRTTWRYFRKRCFDEGRSKALITDMVGARDALSTERSYVLKALPAGVVRGIGDALRGDRWGLARAAAIVAGLMLTTAGYLLGTASRLLRSRPAERKTDGSRGSAPFEPTRVVHVELSEPLPAVSGARKGDDPGYRQAAVYARWNSIPIGMIRVPLPEDDLDPETLASSLWEHLGEAIRDRADELGLGDLEPLDADGYRSVGAVSRETPTFPSATVIIATRDRPELLERCLRSVQDLTYPDFDVVIVDSAPSSDETATMLRDRFADRSDITYLAVAEPGLGRAHNAGIEVARGSILAFTDDDVVVDRGWLTHLAAPFEDPEVGCVTGMIAPMSLDTRAQLWLEDYAGYSKGSRRAVFRRNGGALRDALHPYAAGRFGSGANMAFRAEVLRALGGFDPALGVGSPSYSGDDLAAFFEVIAGGRSLVYEPAALVHHEHYRDEAGLGRVVFGYGAGLTAYLTKLVIDRPGRALDLAWRVPRGMWYALSNRSPKNRRQTADFPRHLRRRELLGMLLGPFAYLRSRRRLRRSESGRS